jgi:hypothetical protein
MGTNFQRVSLAGPPPRHDLGQQRQRQAALDAAIAAIRARFGQHIIRLAGDLAQVRAVSDRPPLSCGSFGLDLLTGGLPRGTITEYAGGDGSGRETLAATALARAQAAGGLALLVDPDGTADPDALAAAGVVLDALPIAYPATMAQAATTLGMLCRCGALDLMLVASLSALVRLPTGVRAGWPARLLSRLSHELRGRRTALLMVNAPVPGEQWRTVAETPMARVTALRLAFHGRGVQVGPHGDLEGLQTQVRVIKHRGHSHGTVFDLVIKAGGPDHTLELVRLARQLGCAQETPLGLQAAGLQIGRTENHAAITLERDPVLARALEEQVRRDASGFRIQMGQDRQQPMVCRRSNHAYAACSSTQTSAHRFWKRRRCSTRDTV